MLYGNNRINRVPEDLKDLFNELLAQGNSEAEVYGMLNLPYSANFPRAKDYFKNKTSRMADALKAAEPTPEPSEPIPDPIVDDVPDATPDAKKGKFFKPGGAFDKASGGFSEFMSNVTNPQFDYAWKTKADPATGQKFTGVQGWGKNLGGMYNIANAGIQGVKAAQGLQDISDTRGNMEDLISDIRIGAGNSPTIMYDLNANQRDLLRELQRGDYDTTVNGDDIDLLGALGDTAMGALAGLPGGLPGAIIGGVGGLANSVIGDLNAGSDRRTAELEALYQAVLESEQYHNNMRKQRAYAGLY